MVVDQGSGLTAGTAGDGYRAAPLPHPFEPRPADPGERPTCRRCPREKWEHVPSARGGTR